jgi:hypothetical protein
MSVVRADIFFTQEQLIKEPECHHRYDACFGAAYVEYIVY